jgi:hypothetical protein
LNPTVLSKQIGLFSLARWRGKESTKKVFVGTACHFTDTWQFKFEIQKNIKKKIGFFIDFIFLPPHPAFVLLLMNKKLDYFCEQLLKITEEICDTGEKVLSSLFYGTNLNNWEKTVRLKQHKESKFPIRNLTN